MNNACDVALYPQKMLKSIFPGLHSTYGVVMKIFGREKLYWSEEQPLEFPVSSSYMGKDLW